MRRTLTTLALAAAMLLAVLPGAAAHRPLSDVIPLPNGFFPEGIAIGFGTTFYTGSLIDGAIYEGDLATGEGDILVPGVEGQLAVGMSFDSRNAHLHVAGGSAGTLRIYDTGSGALVDDISLGVGFVNDVIVTVRAAYVTNSFAPEIYEVPLDAQGDVAGPPRTIPLGGDFVFVPGEFNGNGIEWRNGTVILVNSFVGALYAVDPGTGAASTIDLGGAVVNGDGLVLVGNRLYAVVGSLNQITEIRLAHDLSRGRVIDTITADEFDVPTTADVLGGSIFAVNAKFGTPPTPNTPYEVVRADR